MCSVHLGRLGFNSSFVGYVQSPEIWRRNWAVHYVVRWLTSGGHEYRGGWKFTRSCAELCNTDIYVCSKDYYRRSSLNGINKKLVERTLLRLIMGWEIVYLDILLVPLSILIMLSYQCFLVWRVRNKPLQTVIGVNHLARRQWVFGIMKVWPYIHLFFTLVQKNPL